VAKVPRSCRVSSSAISQRSASAPSAHPSGPREAFWCEKKGYPQSCSWRAQEQSWFGGTACFTLLLPQALGPGEDGAERTCRAAVFEGNRLSAAGPSPPFMSYWPPPASLSRGKGISISGRGCSCRTCALSRCLCGGRGAASTQPDSRQWGIQAARCLTRPKPFWILASFSFVDLGFFPPPAPVAVRSHASSCAQLGLTRSCLERLLGASAATFKRNRSPLAVAAPSAALRHPPSRSGQPETGDQEVLGIAQPRGCAGVGTQQRSPPKPSASPAGSTPNPVARASLISCAGWLRVPSPR